MFFKLADYIKIAKIMNYERILFLGWPENMVYICFCFCLIKAGKAISV